MGDVVPPAYVAASTGERRDGDVTPWLGQLLAHGFDVTGETVTAALMNAHIRDNFDSLVPGANPGWTTWSPTQNFTVGDGTETARYMRLGKVVFVHYTFTLGSTSTMGTPQISTPVTATGYVATRNTVGTSFYFEDGASAFSGTVRLLNVNTFLPRYSQNEIAPTSGVPFVWGQNDVLHFTATYEAA
jgi:hypothetical protein